MHGNDSHCCDSRWLEALQQCRLSFRLPGDYPEADSSFTKPFSGGTPFMAAVLAPVSHRNGNGSQIGLKIARMRPGPVIASTARHADILARTARTGNLVGLLLAIFIHSGAVKNRGRLARDVQNGVRGFRLVHEQLDRFGGEAHHQFHAALSGLGLDLVHDWQPAF
jgi:hypothetical protein